LLISSHQQNWRKGQNSFCLEARGRGAGRKNDPNQVCTYEYMNKEGKKANAITCDYVWDMLYLPPFL
jgi:hypothetical protein